MARVRATCSSMFRCAELHSASDDPPPSCRHTASTPSTTCLYTRGTERPASAIVLLPRSTKG